MSLAASAGRGPGTLWSPTHVQVTVLQARGLRAKGPGGTSDAYAVIQVGKEKYATSVSERSLGAPVWREEATFELPPLLSSGAGAGPAAAATLQLTVLHRALLGLDKFLGRAEVDLRELHRDQGRRKTQWYTLKSKPGKKDKQRGEIEVDIQFMRNNMTASMFDLSVKDKSRNPFGKLKDKIKGKNKDSASDTVSAIVPSGTPSVDSDEESFSKEKKKKSKIKTLFSKSNLQKTPLSQSMLVLPTSKPDKMLLRPGDFQSRWDEDDNEDEASSASDVMSHKRTASADLKQPSQTNLSLPRKEGLSFLGGLRSKSDSLSRSNVCINGSHVYMEQPEAKNESKDSSPSSFPSPQGLGKKHLFSSTENLASWSPKDPEEGGGLSSDRRLSDSFHKDCLEPKSLPFYQPQDGRDTRENMGPANVEAMKETKDSKKQESKKSSLLSLVMGKKDVAKGGEGESPSTLPGKEKEDTVMQAQLQEEDHVKKSEKDAAAIASRQSNSLNPFEDVQLSEPEAALEFKSELKLPVPAARAPQTKAVKPRLEVSPEAQPKARLPSPLDSALLFSPLPSSSAQAPVSFDLGCDSETQSSESPSVFSSFSSPISTSTPLEHWLPMGKGEASSEEPSLLLKADLQKESLTPAPNSVPSALGTHCEQLFIPEQEGTEASLGDKTRETDTEKEASNEKSGKCLLEQPDVGQQERFQRIPSPEQGCIPSPEKAQEAPFALSFHSGRIAGPVENFPVGGNSDSEGQSGSFEENNVSDDRMTSAIQEVTPPLQEGEVATPFDVMMQKLEEISVNAGGGQKKVKKRVSFSKQLFMEEEAENPIGLREEDENHPQRLTHEGAAAGSESHAETPASSHTEDTGKEPSASEAPLLIHSHEESFSTHEASSVRDAPLFKTEAEDALTAQGQSKANDHEGWLSDPLSGLPSASDMKSPLMADLNLSLPSIPEVASDDERVDEAGDVRKAAKPVTLEAGASSLDMSPPCLEKAKGLSGRPHEPVPVESVHDFKAETSKAAPSEQTALLDIPNLHLNKSSSVDKETLDHDAGEEKKLRQSERPSPPPCMSLDCPVPSRSLSETFPAIRSFPSSPHSDTHTTSTAESPKKATPEGPAGKVENFGKRKPLLQAWVSPSETHLVSAQPGAGAGAAKHRLHPVKPMNTAPTKITNSSLGTATIISENVINEAMMKKYNPSDPAFAYAQLTHEELIQLVLKQKETISKKEFQVRELEDYIDNLLVRVMEETPNILRIPAQVKKAGKM